MFLALANIVNALEFVMFNELRLVVVLKNIFYTPLSLLYKTTISHIYYTRVLNDVKI